MRPLLRLATAGLLTALASAPSHAHGGHGLFGAHWHATDTLGFVGLALAVGAALWCSRK